jgi:ubiquinol-cytochrome c reductase iron-sulfur subunit
MSSRVGATAFGVSMVASVALVVVYLSGGSRLWEGVLLGFALGGLGAGIIVWARVIDTGPQTEDRPPLESDAEGQPIEGPDITRRRLLVRMAMGAGGTLAVALGIPTLSLGPTPGDSLYQTKWKKGARLVGDNGLPIRPEDVSLEGVLTVFPADEIGSEDSQTQLIRVDESLLDLPEERADWAAEGCVGYSKLCTHAGCPVGLYRAEAHELLCPCHQSTFDVLRGAVPVYGPAVRPLPQLPLGIDDEGYLIALGDFNEPVGPSFWNVTS